MSRFRKLSQTIWHCQYHIVWTPKYRFRILAGEIAKEVETCIRAFSEQQGCEVMELNVQLDHVHLLALISPKVSVSGYVGTVKGRTAIRVFNKFRKLKEKPYWGNHLILCRHCRSGYRNDPEIHKISRNEGKGVGKTQILRT
jgi:putative transposase